MEWNLSLFILLIYWMSFSSAENATNKEGLLNSGNTNNSLLPTSLEKYCWGKICSEHQFCSDLLTCRCCPGFISYNDYCVPCKGEYEKCETTADCCGMLLCINGICRKPVPNAEFITLSKICLAVTATAIFIATFSFLIKCLVKYGKINYFRQGNVTSDSNSVHDYMRQFISPRAPAFPDMRQEKPPSYEECVRGPQRVEYSEPPPPYVVPINAPQIGVSNNNNISNNNGTQSPAAPIINQQTPRTTVLNVQSLPKPINLNPSPAQV